LSLLKTFATGFVLVAGVATEAAAVTSTSTGLSGEGVSLATEGNVSTGGAAAVSVPAVTLPPVKGEAGVGNLAAVNVSVDPAVTTPPATVSVTVPPVKIDAAGSANAGVPVAPVGVDVKVGANTGASAGGVTAVVNLSAGATAKVELPAVSVEAATNVPVAVEASVAGATVEAGGSSGLKVNLSGITLGR
jgi:hypothetical protein